VIPRHVAEHCSVNLFSPVFDHYDPQNMALTDDPIERLCQRKETIDLAKDIFRQAKVKTRDGSGYQLGSSTTGLPAICSLIASERYETTLRV